MKTTSKKLLKSCLTLLLTLMMVLPTATPTLGAVTAYAAANTDKNVALYKPVVCDYGNNASAVTDGITASGYWDSADHTPASVTIDLEGYYKLSSFTVVGVHFDSPRYNYYNIEVSTDGINFEIVAQKNTNDLETEKGTTFEVDCTAQFVRVTVTKNSANGAVHLCEVIAMGHADSSYTPPETPKEDPADPKNIAYAKPTRANANTNYARLVVNGSTTDMWTGIDVPQYVDIDLLDNYDITDFTVWMPSTTGQKYQYVVYTSLDGVNFTRAARSEFVKPTKEGDTYTFKTPITARVIRVNVIANSAGNGAGAAISEVKVHGAKNEKVAVTPTREKFEFSSYTDWLKETEGVTVKTDKDGHYDISETYTTADTTKALQGLITRILGAKYVDWFTFEFKDGSNGNDYFTLSDNSGKIKITANNGVAAAMGLNHYLKYYCKVDVSQQTSNPGNMPASVVALGKTITKDTPMEVRYAYNYCTLSYTMPFFGYDEWQRELDYLMLSGVNVILDTTATEALWIAYLQQYGYSGYQALDFVCGYVYKAWWLMGNLEGYGGNVSDAWVYDTLEMARVNQRYMTVMGAQPCLQAFVGTLPINFGTMAAETLQNMGYSDPADYMTGTGGWSGFTRPYVINTTYDGYAKLAEDFYAIQASLYGEVTDYFAGDFFHEIGITPPAVFNKADMSVSTLDAMTQFNPKGVWILQSWWSNPLQEVLDGFGDRRVDHILLLDLAAAASPRWSSTTMWKSKEFDSSSWVFCILDNYGGRTGVHGTLQKTATDIDYAMKNAQYMRGIGITPEGTQQNPVVFELFWECIWEDEAIDVKEWIKDYAVRRYGAESENAAQAWLMMVAPNGIYGVQTADGTSVNNAINNNPSLTAGAATGSYFEHGYYQWNFEKSITLLMKDFDKFSSNPNYVYDIVAFLMQELTARTNVYIKGLKQAVTDKDYDDFVYYQGMLLEAMELIDEVAAYDKDTMFGNWIGRAYDWAADKRTGDYDDYGVDMMEINAKVLLTTWANRSLGDYAYRQYNGLMKDFYIVLWKELTDSVAARLQKNQTITDANLSISGARHFELAWEITASDKEYDREVRPAAGSSKYRSLKAIYEQIEDKHYGGDASNGNIAPEGEAYAESSLGSSSPLNDLNRGTIWIANGTKVPVYAGIRFDTERSVKTIIIVAETRPTLGANNMNYYVEALVNGSYKKIYTGTTYNETDKNWVTTITLDQTIQTSDIRVTLTSNGGIYPALMEIEIYEGEPSQGDEHTPGDVNGDGRISIDDVTTLMAVLSGERPKYVKDAVDVNGDGRLTLKDISRLLAHLADSNIPIY